MGASEVGEKPLRLSHYASLRFWGECFRWREPARVPGLGGVEPSEVVDLLETEPEQAGQEPSPGQPRDDEEEETASPGALGPLATPFPETPVARAGRGDRGGPAGAGRARGVDGRRRRPDPGPARRAEPYRRGRGARGLEDGRGPRPRASSGPWRRGAGRPSEPGPRSSPRPCTRAAQETRDVRSARGPGAGARLAGGLTGPGLLTRPVGTQACALLRGAAVRQSGTGPPPSPRRCPSASVDLAAPPGGQHLPHRTPRYRHHNGRQHLLEDSLYRRRHVLSRASCPGSSTHRRGTRARPVGPWRPGPPSSAPQARTGTEKRYTKRFGEQAFFCFFVLLFFRFNLVHFQFS